MFNFPVVSRCLYSPGELHWCKANHLQIRLLNQDLNSEILAWVIQHLLRFRKTFPQKGHGLVILRLSYTAFMPLCAFSTFTQRQNTAYLLVFSLCEMLLAIFCASTARVQTTAGRTGSKWERKNHLGRTIDQWSKLLLAEVSLSNSLTIYCMNISLVCNFNFTLRRQHPCNTTDCLQIERAF